MSNCDFPWECGFLGVRDVLGRNVFLETAEFARTSSLVLRREDKVSVAIWTTERNARSRRRPPIRGSRVAWSQMGKILKVTPQSLGIFLLLNQNQSRHNRYYLCSSRHQLAASRGLSRPLPKFCDTVKFIINMLANALILVLTSEGVLECITLFSPVCFFFLTVQLCVSSPPQLDNDHCRLLNAMCGHP